MLELELDLLFVLLLGFLVQDPNGADLAAAFVYVLAPLFWFLVGLSLDSRPMTPEEYKAWRGDDPEEDK